MSCIITPPPSPLALVYFAAANAAENALPPKSRQLIDHHDRLHREWSRDGWPLPVPAFLTASSAAVHADQLASIAMELRRKGNDAMAAAHQSATPPKQP